MLARRPATQDRSGCSTSPRSPRRASRTSTSRARSTRLTIARQSHPQVLAAQRHCVRKERRAEGRRGADHHAARRATTGCSARTSTDSRRASGWRSPSSISTTPASRSARRSSEVVQIDLVSTASGLTQLRFSRDLDHDYEREWTTLNANVAPATHGETRTEVLGSGDASKPLQQFVLKQKPITYVASSAASGATSTLAIRVNDVLWEEAPWHYGEPPERVAVRHAARRRRQRCASPSATASAGGACRPGWRTSRRPIGSGLVRKGMVAARQISLLASRPLGRARGHQPDRARRRRGPRADRGRARQRAAHRAHARPGRVAVRLRGLRARVRRHREGSRRLAVGPRAAHRASHARRARAASRSIRSARPRLGCARRSTCAATRRSRCGSTPTPNCAFALERQPAARSALRARHR